MTRLREQSGSGVTLAMVALLASSVVMLVGFDLGAYLLGAARAQAAADAGALAAAGLDDPLGIVMGPLAVGDRTEAARVVVVANRARLLRCDVLPGGRGVEVEVDVRVNTIFVGRLAGRRVSATATAKLVRDPRPRR